MSLNLEEVTNKKALSWAIDNIIHICMMNSEGKVPSQTIGFLYKTSALRILRAIYGTATNQELITLLAIEYPSEWTKP